MESLELYRKAVNLQGLGNIILGKSVKVSDIYAELKAYYQEPDRDQAHPTGLPPKD